MVGASLRGFEASCSRQGVTANNSGMAKRTRRFIALLLLRERLRPSFTAAIAGALIRPHAVCFRQRYLKSCRASLFSSRPGPFAGWKDRLGFAPVTASLPEARVAAGYLPCQRDGRATNSPATAPTARRGAGNIASAPYPG